MVRRYHKTRRAAEKYLETLVKNQKYITQRYDRWGIYRQPKGTRHHGMFYIGTYLEWLNFAN